MKHGAALATIEDRPWEAPGTIPEWEIEELSDVRERVGSGLSNRLLGALIAVAVGIVGFGFSGHWSSPDPASGPAATALPAATAEPPAAPAVASLLTLSAPVDGTRVDGSLVEVRGFARRALGTVHLAVWLGGAVLGWTNLEVGGAGPVRATIRVFAPPFDLPVVLRVSSATAGREAGVAMTVALHMRAAPGVTLWRCQLVGPQESRLVKMEGVGPRTTGAVEIEVRTASGNMLAASTGRIGDEDGRPGAPGGRMLGLGSFTLRLTLDKPPPTGELLVIVTWHDASGGMVRTVTRTVDRPANPRSLPPHGAR